ncbi:MAG: hypothetical protein HKN13_10515 [Rhodothermales bacterium]|nr:hypothetical protein [Rhodothermales bacterium]
MTRQTGIMSSRIEADRLTPYDGLGELLQIHGQPFDPPNGYLDYALYGTAAEGPARVVLDGLEGDVTLSHGIHYLDELAAAGDWRRFFMEAGAIRSRLSGNMAALFGEYALPHVAGMPLMALAAGIPAIWRHGGTRSALRAVKRRVGSKTAAASRSASRRLLISSDLERTVGWNEMMRDEPHESPVSEQQAHIQYLKGAYVPSVLEFTHANARYFGLEARHPMFDLRLIKLAVGMRPGLKLHDGWNRYALREAVAGMVPDDVRWRPEKATLAPNFDLKMANLAKESIDVARDAGKSGLAEFLDMERFAELADRKRFRKLWPALVLALYLKNRDE